MKQKKSQQAKQKVKHGKGQLKTKIILLSVLPVLILGFLVLVICIVRISSIMKEDTETSLRATAESVLGAYNQNSGDYFQNESGDIWKGGYNVSKSDSLLDSIHEKSDMDVTFFYGKKRIATSIKDRKGEKILGSPAGKVICNEVLKKGKPYFTSKVSVDGVRYYGYYLPVQQNSKVIGMIFTGIKKSSVDNKIYHVCALVALFVLIIVCVTILVVWRISKQLIWRILQGVDAVDHIAGGDLCVEINRKAMKQEDEISNLLLDMQRLQEYLCNIVNNLRQHTDELGNSATDMNHLLNDAMTDVDQMSQAISQIAESAKDQAVSAQDATESIMLMERMIDETMGETKHLTVEANSMTKEVGDATDTLNKLNATNENVLQAVDRIQEDTVHTNDAAEKIKQVIDIIMDIAEETNLLALNASIEAARAGEAGSGFAVVALQIQKLADQTNQSTETIHQIVETLSENSNHSVQTMEEVQNVIQLQTTDIHDAKERFQSVSEKIQRSLQGIQDIENAITKLDSEKGNIVDMISTLSAAAQENDANTSMTSESVQAVREVVEQLKQSSDGLKRISKDIEESTAMFKM